MSGFAKLISRSHLLPLSPNHTISLQHPSQGYAEGDDGRVDGETARRSHILDYGLQDCHRSSGAETPDKVAGCLGGSRPIHVQICEEGSAEL